MAPRRIYNNNNSNGGRVVTLGGGGGGLNERFSQLDKSNKKPAQGGSVFSRIRGNNTNNNKPGRRNVPSIQNRLSRPVQAGIRKRNPGASAAQGSVRGNQRNNRGAVTKGRNGNRLGQGQQRNTNNRANTKQQRPAGTNAGRAGRGGRNKNDNNRKPLTAQDLDKSLDAYMMKDAKTAQSKLDDELDSYMDESGDVLMDL